MGLRADQSDNKARNQVLETTVMALGVHFDTVKLEWHFNDKTISLILSDLLRVEKGESSALLEMQSLSAKLNLVSHLFEEGIFFLDGFYYSMEDVFRPDSSGKAIPCLIFQARWRWVSSMVSQKHSPIIHPDAGVFGNAL